MAAPLLQLSGIKLTFGGTPLLERILLMPSEMSRLRIGLFSIGLDAYWPQFAGLKERLEGYTQEVAAKLRASGAE